MADIVIVAFDLDNGQNMARNIPRVIFSQVDGDETGFVEQVYSSRYFLFLVAVKLTPRRTTTVQGCGKT